MTILKKSLKSELQCGFRIIKDLQLILGRTIYVIFVESRNFNIAIFIKYTEKEESLYA